MDIKNSLNFEELKTLVSSNLAFAELLHGYLQEYGEDLPAVFGKASNQSKRLRKLIGPDRKLDLSKDSEGMRGLLAHKDERIRKLAEAKLATSSWPLHIRRVDNLINFATARQGKIGIPVKYSGAHCVLPGTEVLTKTGWVPIEEWDDKNPIMQWDPVGELTWCKAVKNIFTLAEPVLHLRRKGLEAVFTCNHKIPHRASKCRSVQVKEAAELAILKNTEVFTCGKYCFENGYTSNQLRFFAMVQADGSLAGRNKTSIRLSFKKERKITRCRALLELLAIKFTCSIWASGQRTFSILQEDIPKWAMAIKRENKLLGAYLLKSSLQARLAFLDELKYWDGYSYDGSHTYYTKQKQNADWVQLVAHVSGKQAGMFMNSWGGWTVRIKTDRKCWVREHDWSAENYAGKVYCPTTVTGYWIHRYNNTVMISHNTHRNSGTDGVNFYNLPKRPKKGYELIKDIKNLVRAPKGYVLLTFDYSQIEARYLAYIAGQTDLVEAFREGRDVYSEAATHVFKKMTRKPGPADPPPVVKQLTMRRNFGKMEILGSGYGMGATTFYNRCSEDDSLRAAITLQLAGTIIKSYRKTYSAIPKFWKTVENLFKFVVKYPEEKMTKHGLVVEHDSKYNRILLTLPSGSRLYYPQVTKSRSSGNLKWLYSRGASFWGGPITENIVQSTSRDILVDAMLSVKRAGYNIAADLYDSFTVLVKKEAVKDAEEELTIIACKPPEWCATVPLAVEMEVSETL